MNDASPSLCDQKVFTEVFESYSDTLFRRLYYRCGDKDLAQDVVQDAFTKLWEKCASVAWERARGFVFRTAQNLLTNVFQRRKVHFKFESRATQEVNHQDPSFILQQAEFKRQLESAISQLSEKQREVFLMSRVDKMKYKEIAQRLDISVKAVEKRMYAALTELRKISKMIR